MTSCYVPVKTTYYPSGPVFRDAFIMCNNGGNDKSLAARQIKAKPFMNGTSRFMLTGVDTPATMFKTGNLKGSKTGVAKGSVWMSTSQASYKWPKKAGSSRHRWHGADGGPLPRPMSIEVRADPKFDGYTQSQHRRTMTNSASAPSLRPLRQQQMVPSNYTTHRRSHANAGPVRQGQALTRPMRGGSASDLALASTQPLGNVKTQQMQQRPRSEEVNSRSLRRDVIRDTLPAAAMARA